MWKLFNKKSPDRVSAESQAVTVDAPKKDTQKKDGDAKKTKTVVKKATTLKTIKPQKHNMGAGFGIIVAPLVSEKSARVGEHDTYAFIVTNKANKVEIKKAFHKMYGVAPISIQVSNSVARRVVRGRTIGTRPGFKKAFVRVPKGSNIHVYEGV